jgi:hypothetical protein
MDFEPRDMSIKALLNTFETFNVPSYQRDYSWEKQYYANFLNDIINCIEINEEELCTTSYFLGTMVFSGTGNKISFDVVDGQQRLTVITILLSIISKKFLKINEKDLSEATFRYVKYRDDNAEWKTRLVSSTSYPYLEAYIQSLEETEIITPETDEEINLKETYDYYNEQLSKEKILKKINKKSYKDVLLVIRDQILSSIVISISTPNKESAYRIFEILNAKGKSLASIDLIKNSIFENYHNDSNAKEGIVIKLWENIKNNLRLRNQSIGFVTFYRHYWISKYTKTTAAKLYDEFKKHIPKEKYMDFLLELEKESKTYLTIISPSLKEDFKNRKEYNWLVRSLDSLSNISPRIVQTRIILLALFDLKNRNLISSTVLKKTILYLENFIFMYSVIGQKQANIYENIFSKVAIELRKVSSKDEAYQVLEKNLYKELDKKYIEYNEFEEKFINFTFTKKNKKSNVITKYILNKLNISYSGSENFEKDSTIEHIINENKNDPLTYNIGNLICLEDKLNNNEAKKLPFNQKKEIYQKSSYKEVKEFLKEYQCFDNNKNTILNRARKMARYYYNNILSKK